MMRRLTISWLLGFLMVACTKPVTAPAPAAIAPFVATSANNGTTPPRNECWMAGRFDGLAILRGQEIELLFPAAWVAVTRDNDKQSDDLHLVVEVSRHPLGPAQWPPVTSSIPIVLQPTVDSAGPQLTTWQASDTLRMLVPYSQGLGPRWLIFRLRYRTLSHRGVPAECDGALGTDTLRFGRSGH